VSVDLSVDSIGDSFEPREDFISSLTRWYGRELSWNDFPQLFTDVERRITDLILRGDRQSELLIYKLAWIGSSPEKRPLIEKQIAHLIRTSDGWEIQQVGFGKSCSKGWKSACKAAEKAWDATCKAAEKTCDFVVDFWEENKKEIIIGIVVVTTAVVETAVTIYTGGTGTQIAVAGGAALVQSFVDDPSNKSIPGAPPITPPFPQPSPTGISLGYINPIQITPFATPSEVMIPAPQLPTPPALPQPIFQTFDPQLSLEGLYGRDYVSRIYEQFLLPDPYLQSTPPLNVPALPIETIPKGPSVGEFIALIETKLGETRNPNYSDQWKLKNEGPSNAQQFRELLAQKLAEPADPNYLANLMPKHEGPSNAQQIRELISDKLREVDDPNYWATMETIRNLFPTTDISVSRDNYG